MAGSKEIRVKIKSVQNTRKITKAMEMVAASKMRKAQERMRATRPYGEKIRQVTAHLANAHPEYQHSYLVHRESVKSVGFILVTSDKGLCGGLNTNVLRQLTHAMSQWDKQGVKVELVTIGNKGLGFIQRMGGKIIAQVTQLGDTPHLEKLIGPVKVMLDRYANGDIDAVFIAYNRFVNTMKQEPTIEPLLPLAKGQLEEHEKQKTNNAWDYIYEPDPKAVIDELMVRYVEALVYQAVTENIASEQSARMVAMKAASDNAGNVIGELQLIYNKSRQAAITKELSEIVGGAAAV
ncbi:ATP synthase gamma chain [Ferrovum sp. JA12]|uniref:F0F1 ATP synthase subunit gamma n=1 Tax=Ferrovum sp. JA12 TaxID=1356299 RepID=UPI0007037D6A|nr:F0F1 ATP synthase subunit gamma [Ferrovum sp. JA12]KRH79381.1 ATP synthase gamma chain [Ferrovum sp. JA12]